MYGVKTPIYLIEHIREFERLADERFSVTPHVLMQRAGKAAFDFLQKRWLNARRLAVFCGGGNNGGDGYVLAQLAHERGLAVTVWQVVGSSQLKGEAKLAYESCKQAGVSIQPYDKKADLQHPDVLVDAICGVGLTQPLRTDMVAVIERLQQLELPIFALDVPTGIDADTGQVLGTALHATATITFIGLKLGLMTGHGIAYSGELVSNDLQLPPDIFSLVEPVAKKIHMNTYAHYLKPRMRDWHKGLSGHVLIVGGELGFSGAPRMAGEAALRVGAGLVSVATKPENAIVMNTHLPELMCHGVTSAKDLAPLIERADVIVLGPGLGQTSWSKTMWKAAMEADLPKVVDADALNILANENRREDNWVLTPHPGEAARLIEKTLQDVQNNRMSAVKELHRRYGGVSVLKGAGSLVLSPNSLPALCDKGNAGMASAGMGDVLSGVIGGLIAQGVPIGDAAKLGVQMHALAGDMATKDGERGMVATDLIPCIRKLANYSTQGS